MPVHDWSRVDANLFHDFRQAWSIEIRNALNLGLLPLGYSALVEQHASGLVPDVLAVQRRTSNGGRPTPTGGLMTVDPPRTKHIFHSKQDNLAARANRIAIRHRLGEVVCIIEIVSPGNKSSRGALQAFVNKTHEFLNAGVNVLVVDLLPPTPRAPHGIHKAIWDEIEDVPFELTAEQPLVLAAYAAGDPTVGRSTTGYVEPVAVGANLPDMPAYLDADYHVMVPLEAAYQSAWDSCPNDMRYLVEHGRLPDEA
ncbi:MAG TPA: DUF4058 family protein [Gemmataceae bacterium]|jgi:hypothetical protein|nr:DUF4058 family protein [Gemmataceae bacterium]